jgi:hypothetical protein
MSIPSVGAGSATVLPMLPDRGEKASPDTDHADDSGAKSAVQAAPASGTGKLVDKTV